MEALHGLCMQEFGFSSQPIPRRAHYVQHLGLVLGSDASFDTEGRHGYPPKYLWLRKYRNHLRSLVWVGSERLLRHPIYQDLCNDVSGDRLDYLWVEWYHEPHGGVPRALKCHKMARLVRFMDRSAFNSPKPKPQTSVDSFMRVREGLPEANRWVYAWNGDLAVLEPILTYLASNEVYSGVLVLEYRHDNRSNDTIDDTFYTTMKTILNLAVQLVNEWGTASFGLSLQTFVVSVLISCPNSTVGWDAGRFDEVLTELPAVGKAWGEEPRLRFNVMIHGRESELTADPARRARTPRTDIIYARTYEALCDWLSPLPVRYLENWTDHRNFPVIEPLLA